MKQATLSEQYATALQEDHATASRLARNAVEDGDDPEISIWWQEYVAEIAAQARFVAGVEQ